MILENGHTVMIVTNGTLTNRIVDYMNFPDELKKRLGFKFSFHYLELIRLDLLNTFFENVDLVKKNGCTISVELTPNDEYEEYIPEIKEICHQKLGALCHLSVPRNEKTTGIDLLSSHSKDEFYDVWKDFKSPMFEFKMRHWNKKRHEKCNAGLWSSLLSLSNGTLTPCYSQRGVSQNIFKNIDKPIVFVPVKKCKLSHCYNAHSFLTFGNIPEINEETYLDIRDRVCADGSRWVNLTMKEQFCNRLEQYNDVSSSSKRIKFSIERKKLFIRNAFKKLHKAKK